MKIKTNALTGAVLDWAVAKAEGLTNANMQPAEDIDGYSPSTDWGQGGPIIEKERLQITTEQLSEWVASTPYVVERDGYRKYCFNNGPTPLIAAMRCYVSSKLGDEVEIPEELLP